MWYRATTCRIRAPRDVVWDVLIDLEHQTEWIEQATRVTITSKHGVGLGSTFERIRTVGWMHTTDKMQVFRWDPPKLFGIRNFGMIRGIGLFRLTERHGITSLTWHEEMHVPLYLGGVMAEWSAGPVRSAVWKRDLANLKRLIEERVTATPDRIRRF